MCYCKNSVMQSHDSIAAACFGRWRMAQSANYKVTQCYYGCFFHRMTLPFWLRPHKVNFHFALLANPIFQKKIFLIPIRNYSIFCYVIFSLVYPMVTLIFWNCPLDLKKITNFLIPCYASSKKILCGLIHVT